MTVISGPKGTRDFYPGDMAQQQRIFDSWQKTCGRYGFERYDGPLFESKELFTKKSGEEIEKQLYGFVDKAGRELALRPEMTPTLARMVAAAGSNLKRPIRWYSICRLFRYEKMQKGRLREFFQLNMDILGAAEVSADAELIAAAVAMMRDLGFSSDDFSVRISSRTLLEALFAGAGIGGEQCAALFALLDKKSKLPPEEFEALLDAAVPDGRTADAVRAVFRCRSLDDAGTLAAGLPALDELRRLFGLLGCYGIAEYAEFDIGVVRGLAYYTGVVFEIFDKRKTMRAVAGGGRYDTLVELYGGQPTPAVGFAAGDVVLAELMREKGLFPRQQPRSACFLVALDESDYPAVIALAQELRGRGISCEFAFRASAVGKQLKIADSGRVRLALFVGGDEAKSGMVKVKNMSTGEETLCSRTAVADAVDRLLSGPLPR